MSAFPLQFRSPTGPRLPANASWMYLGWDVQTRARLAERWGRAPCPLGRLLSDAADRLRIEFLDLVAAWGRGQTDPPAWWAGTLAWKSWSASNLFQLCCYLAVCERLASDARARPAERLVVVIEDPWLLRQARAALGGVEGVSFTSAPPLWPLRLVAFLRGAARRVRWAARMIRSAVLTAASPRRAPRPDASPPGAPAVLVHSYLLDCCLRPDRWDDPYFPGLEEELRGAGAVVVRCTDPDVTGFERRLSARDAVEPLIRHASLRGFVRALIALPPPVPGPFVLDGLPVDELVRREFWHDLSRAGRCAHLLLWDAAERLLAARPWAALVLAWEGQPPERLLALAARRRGIRVVGSQHTTVSAMQLPFFLGRGEAQWAPWPDVLLTSGPRPRRLLAAGGVPEERLRPGGSRRFHAPAGDGSGPAATPSEVLIILPVDPLRARHMLAAVARAYPSGGEGFSFAVKPHPGDPCAPDALPFPVRVTGAPLAQALESAGVALFTSTAAGLEVLLLGRAALRYRPDVLVDVDPCDVFDDSALPTVGDEGLRDALEALRREPRRPSIPAVRAAFAELFSPQDSAAWRREILGD